MRKLLEGVEARRVSEEIQRLGVAPGQRVRVIVETLDDLSITAVNGTSGSSDFLDAEPDIYTKRDLRERNV